MPRRDAVDSVFSSWAPPVIKAAIAMRGSTLTKLATDNGLNPSACRQSLLRPQPRADKVISRFLGVPLNVLWPERYDEFGDAIRHVRADSKHEHDENHRQIGKAA